MRMLGSWKIQSNWEKAIDDIEEYSSHKGIYSTSYISYTMGFSLDQEDISKLALIYKNAPEGSKRRLVIKQILEDMNYHTERSDFSSGNFDKYIITENKGE